MEPSSVIGMPGALTTSTSLTSLKNALQGTAKNPWQRIRHTVTHLIYHLHSMRMNG